MDIGKTLFHFLGGALLTAVASLYWLDRMSWFEFGVAVVLGGLLVAVLRDRFWENLLFWRWFLP